MMLIGKKEALNRMFNDEKEPKMQQTSEELEER